MKQRLTYGDFDVGEYVHRIARTRALMEREGLDVLLLACEDNIRWLSGFSSQLFSVTSRPFVLVFPRVAELQAELFVPSDVQAAYQQTWIERVHYWDRGSSPPFDESSTAVDGIVGWFLGQGLARSRCGIELRGGMRSSLACGDLLAIQGQLRETHWVDVSEIMGELRSAKSCNELGLLERLADITLASVMEVGRSLQLGWSELDIARRLAAKMIEYGALKPIHLQIHVGPRMGLRANMYPQESVRVSYGDLVYIDAGAHLNGYASDVARFFCLGNPSRNQALAYEAEVAASDRVLEVAAPGVPIRELYAVAIEEVKRRGFGHLVASKSIGHGIGLAVHEMPDLGKESGDVLAPGMALCLEPWLIDVPYGEEGLFVLEDMVVVTKDGVALWTQDGRQLNLVE